MIRLALLSTTLLVALFHPVTFAQDADAAADEAAAAAEGEAEEGSLGAPKSLDEAGGMVKGWIEDAKTWVEEDGGAALMSFVVFLVILIVFRILAGILGNLTRKTLSSSKFNASDLLKDFASGTVRKVVFLIGLIIALDALGLPVGPLVAGIGVVGFVVGFALQDTLGNFAAGIMILLYRPFDVGDFVEAGGVTGSVVNMTLVSTTFKTPDNQKVIVPNSSIWGGTITNYAANPTRRIDLTIGIGYSDDIDKAEQVLAEVIKAHPNVLEEPAPTIQLKELADSSVNFAVRPWTKTPDFWGTKCDLTKAIKQRFDKEGISIPFPQRDVHLFKED